MLAETQNSIIIVSKAFIAFYLVLLLNVMSLCYTDNPRLMSRVPVYVRVLDVNDNAPTFATYYETFVCENAKANQVMENNVLLF